METTQHGYLVLADISGFTSYLAKVELDHANAVLTELLENIVGRFKILLLICKLEGDAVLAYAPESRVPYGETLLELLEATYASFRDGVEAARRQTTCECRACQAIPTLDLKFFVHHADYIVQNISGIRELVGSDVNLIHRLMKNHVTEATGWKAYALFTERGLEHLKIRPDGLHPQIETYEHLGDIQTYSLNTRARYDEMVSARREAISAKEADVITQYDYPAPPPVIWEWLNDPHKRARIASQDGLVFKPASRPGGRTGIGAQTHCMHGKDVAMVETVLDWRPFDYFTVNQKIGLLFRQVTFRFVPIENGTHLEIYERGRGTYFRPLDRLITIIMCKFIFPTIDFARNLARRLDEEMTSQ